MTLPKLKRAVYENRVTADLKGLFNRNRHSALIVYSLEGRNAYWLLWSSGSAIMSMLGIMYPNRSLAAMAETLGEGDPGWSHRFASDLDCLDQYNYCACEVVVTDPHRRPGGHVGGPGAGPERPVAADQGAERV